MNERIFFSLFFFASLFANAQDASSIVGQWKDKDNPDKQIEIYAQTQDGFFGKSINDTTKKDMLVFKNLIYQKDNSYKGKLINPSNGDEIEVVIHMLNKNNFEFKVRKFLLSKTFHFVRIK